MSDTCTFAEFLDHCTGRKVMPPPAQAKKRPSCPPESEEQKALFDWWQRTPYARHFVMYHIPNGGRRDKITGARLKAEGVVAGVPDVFLASPRQGFHGLYIEMKRQRGGTVQATQKELITALRQAGYRVEVCKGWWEAGSHRKLSDRGNPQRSVQACRASSKPAAPRGSSRSSCRSGKMKVL